MVQYNREIPKYLKTDVHVIQKIGGFSIIRIAFFSVLLPCAIFSMTIL